MGMYYKTKIEIEGIDKEQATEIMESKNYFLNWCIPIPKDIEFDEQGWCKTEKDKERYSEFFRNERSCKMTHWGWTFDFSDKSWRSVLTITAETESKPVKEFYALLNKLRLSEDNDYMKVRLYSFYEELDTSNKNDDLIIHAEISCDPYENDGLRKTEIVRYGRISSSVISQEAEYVPDYII